MRLCYDAIVRTTLDISDEAYHIAKAVARDQNRSLGSVVSDFITGELGTPSASPPINLDDPVFPTFRSRRRTTIEDVKALEDDE
jgi:hypothetical protein